MLHRSSFVQALQKHESSVATGVKPRNGQALDFAKTWSEASSNPI